MSRKIRIRLLAAVFLLLLSGCGRAVRTSPLLLGPESSFSEIVSAALPDFTPMTADSGWNLNLYSEVHRGNLVQCLDVQAVPAISGLGEGAYSPQILLTVVFAVDRTRTDLRPGSWQALRTAGLPVTASHNVLFRRILPAAAAYGLDGPQYDVRDAMALLREVHYSPENPSAPVTVCFDTEAVQRIARGEDLEIIVPEDGTLSLTWGIYSKAPLELDLRRPLLEAGFRLPDGQSLCPHYPEDYSAASAVEDYGRFLTQTQSATRDLRRTVFRENLFGPADGRESALVFYFAIVAALSWTASALHRSPSQEMRRWVWLISVQIVAWLTVTLVKYQLFRASLTVRMLWYSYYLFLTGLPVTLLYIAAIIDRPETSRRIPAWLTPVLLLCPVMVILVFTNDLHQLVFRFDLAGNWEQDYTYGPGYFLIFAYCILSFLTSLVLLIQKSRKSPKRRGWAGPILVALLLVLYNVCYILKLPPVRGSNLSLMFCLFSILFLEAALNAGLLPTNTRYRELFSSSPLSMQLLDRKGRTILAAADAEPLTPMERMQIQSGSATLHRGKNILLHSRPIHGGTALWQEDLTELNRQQEKLCTSIRHMEAANALLHQEGEIRRRKIASEIQVQLFDQLEQDLREKTQELSSLIRNLPRGEERKQQISRIPLLLCHIKRLSNLFFLSRQDPWLNGNELAVYLDELSEFSSYAGVHALVRCGITRPVPVKIAALCYSFYYTLLSWAIEDSEAVLIGQVEERENALIFSLLSSVETDSLTFSDSFLQKLRQAEGSLSVRRVEESQSICLRFPGKGEDTP